MPFGKTKESSREAMPSEPQSQDSPLRPPPYNQTGPIHSRTHVTEDTRQSSTEVATDTLSQNMTASEQKPIDADEEATSHVINTKSPPPINIDYQSPPVPVKELPQDYFDCPMADLAILVSSMLQELVFFNDALPFNADELTRFHSRSVPGISVQDYVVRVIKYCSLEKSILITIVYFIDLLCKCYNLFSINSLTVHRFIITAATVASKGLCDSFCTNSHYARVGGLSKVELNLLEVEFLTRVDYRILPKGQVLNSYYERMVMRMEGTYKLAIASDSKARHVASIMSPSPVTNSTPKEASNEASKEASKKALKATTQQPANTDGEEKKKLTFKGARMSLTKLLIPSDRRKPDKQSLKRPSITTVPEQPESESETAPDPQGIIGGVSSMRVAGTPIAFEKRDPTTSAMGSMSPVRGSESHNNNHTTRDDDKNPFDRAASSKKIKPSPQI